MGPSYDTSTDGPTGSRLYAYMRMQLLQGGKAGNPGGYRPAR